MAKIQATMGPYHLRHPTINLQTILKDNHQCTLAKDINHILMDRDRHHSLVDTTTLHPLLSTIHHLPSTTKQHLLLPMAGASTIMEQP